MDIIKDLKSRIEVAADEVGGTEMEKKVKKATSLENWPATNTQLHELSQGTNDYAAYSEIMPLLWKRLNEPPRNWRTIYKCLVLLEHLIRFGSTRVVDEARGNQFKLRSLQDFHHREGDKDRGTGIREKSKQICDLLADQRQLEDVRRNAAQNLHKFVGVASNGSVNSLGGGGGGGGSSYGGGGIGSTSYDDRGFGGGSGAFGDQASSGGGGGSGGSYDSHPSGSPYDEAVDSGAEKKKKKKAKSSTKEKAPGSDDESAKDPYEEPATAAGEKKKKKKKSADKEEGGDGGGSGNTSEDDRAAKKAAKKAMKIKMREGPPTAAAAASVPIMAAPPAAATAAAIGGDDGFGDFNTASFTSGGSSSAASVAAPSSSFDDEFGAFGSAPVAAAARPTVGGAPKADLLDMFASAHIDGPTTSTAQQQSPWGSSQGASAGAAIDFMSGEPMAPAKAKPMATPNLFDAPTTQQQQKKSQAQQQQQPAAPAPLNAHNNADAFSSFVAGHKAPTPSQQQAPAKAAAASSTSKKGGELAWDNGLINLDGMASAKPTATMVPAPFIPAGSGADPFASLIPQQQQQRQQPQQRGPMGGGQMQMGMPMMGGMGQMGMMPGNGMMMGGMQQPGMGMGMGMGQMQGMQGMGQMGMGMGQMGGMGPMGMGGMQGGMGQMGQMQGGGSFSQSLAFPAAKPNANSVFF